jgi:hypothetical protein
MAELNEQSCEDELEEEEEIVKVIDTFYNQLNKESEKPDESISGEEANGGSIASI